MSRPSLCENFQIEASPQHAALHRQPDRKPAPFRPLSAKVEQRACAPPLLRTDVQSTRGPEGRWLNTAQPGRAGISRDDDERRRRGTLPRYYPNLIPIPGRGTLVQ
jgi:hypothetical protein